MLEATRRTVRQHWAAELGCASDALGSGTTVTTWNGPGVEYLTYDSGAVVGLPSELASEPADPPAFDREALRGWVARNSDVGAVHGPQFVGYCDESTFAAGDGDAMEVGASELEALKAAAPADEWNRSGLALDTDAPTYAVLGDDGPLAAAQTGAVDGVAGVCVLTHPDYRGEGNAAAAVSRATKDALESGAVVEYRTLEKWASSVALAEGLGFERWGRSLLVETT